jgi:hypothetical protein
MTALNAASSIAVAYVNHKQFHGIDPKQWLMIDKNNDGVITEGEFIGHMLVAMQKVDQPTLDLLHRQFKSLSGGQISVKISDINELKDYIQED